MRGTYVCPHVRPGVLGRVGRIQGRLRLPKPQPAPPALRCRRPSRLRKRDLPRLHPVAGCDRRLHRHAVVAVRPVAEFFLELVRRPARRISALFGQAEQLGDRTAGAPTPEIRAGRSGGPRARPGRPRPLAPSSGRAPARRRPGQAFAAIGTTALQASHELRKRLGLLALLALPRPFPRRRRGGPDGCR